MYYKVIFQQVILLTAKLKNGKQTKAPLDEHFPGGSALVGLLAFLHFGSEQGRGALKQINLYNIILLIFGCVGIFSPIWQKFTNLLSLAREA